MAVTAPKNNQTGMSVHHGLLLQFLLRLSSADFLLDEQSQSPKHCSKALPQYCMTHFCIKCVLSLYKFSNMFIKFQRTLDHDWESCISIFVLVQDSEQVLN